MKKQAGWLIYNREDALKNKGYIDWMLDEASKLDLDLHFHFREDLRIGHRFNKLYVEHEMQPISLPDFAIVRTIDPFLQSNLSNWGLLALTPPSYRKSRMTKQRRINICPRWGFQWPIPFIVTEGRVLMTWSSLSLLKKLAAAAGNKYF